MANSALDTTKNEVVTWLQVLPQYTWHDELVIEGNAAALRALAAALLRAADGDGAECADLIASDGEGYTALIRRKERPDDMSNAHYVCQAEWAAAEEALRARDRYLAQRDTP